MIFSAETEAIDLGPLICFRFNDISTVFPLFKMGEQLSYIVTMFLGPISSTHQFSVNNGHFLHLKPLPYPTSSAPT